MQSPGNRLSRLRWMAVPIAAYLAITLVLPIVHGAAIRGSFMRHAAWVVAGCVAVVGVALIVGLVIELMRGGVLRLRRHLGGQS